MSARLSFVTLFIFMLVAAIPASANPEPPEIDHLFDLIVERLEFMPAVAAWKLRNDGPVEDLEREAVVLAAAQKRAAKAGLDGPGTRAFFLAQMAAAKDIQRRHIELWQSLGLPLNQPDLDLDNELRPAISALGTKIIAAIRQSWPLLALLNDDALTDRLAALGVPPDRSEAIVAGLKSIGGAGAPPATAGATAKPAPATQTSKPADPAPLLYATPTKKAKSAKKATKNDPGPQSILDKVLATGRLRIGTTGDYAPFSARKGGTYTGIDIDLAHLLAKSLDAKPVLIVTSWPTLLDDLKANRFDIAMSGISRKPFRQRAGFLSNAYHVGGKTPIIRCADAEKYDSLEKIDQPDVRVIVNPGGTNERFVRSHIKQANIILFKNNRKIFKQLEKARADVMITDAIEVAYQATRRDKLCAAMPGETLSYSEKSFLMPRDQVWLNYVNGWLAQITGDGTLAATFRRHIGGN